MRREDMERLAFLYLCDEEDQNILLGKSKMKLEKFLKFEHWTRKLEFWEYNKSLWDRYSRWSVQRSRKLWNGWSLRSWKCGKQNWSAT